MKLKTQESTFRDWPHLLCQSKINEGKLFFSSETKNMNSMESFLFRVPFPWTLYLKQFIWLKWNATSGEKPQRRRKFISQTNIDRWCGWCIWQILPRKCSIHDAFGEQERASSRNAKQISALGMRNEWRRCGFQKK